MINKLGVDDVLAMFRSALDAGSRQSGAVLGAALLQVLAWMFVAVVVGIVFVVVGLAGAGDGSEQAMRASMAQALPVLMVLFMGLGFVLGPVLGGGMVQVIDNAERGQAGALDAFAGFRGRFPSLAGLAVLGAVGFGLNLLGQWVFGGPEHFASQWAVWDAIASGKMPEPVPPAHPVPNFLWALAVGGVNGVVGLLALPLVQLGGRGTLPAIVDAFRALAGNPGPMLLMAALGIVAMVVAAVVLGVVVLILGLLGAVLPWLAIPLALLALLAWIAGFLVLYHALARAAWQRLFTDGAAAPAGELVV